MTKFFSCGNQNNAAMKQFGSFRFCHIREQKDLLLRLEMWGAKTLFSFPMIQNLTWVFWGSLLIVSWTSFTGMISKFFVCYVIFFKIYIRFSMFEKSSVNNRGQHCLSLFLKNYLYVLFLSFFCT